MREDDKKGKLAEMWRRYQELLGKYRDLTKPAKLPQQEKKTEEEKK